MKVPGRTVQRAQITALALPEEIILRILETINKHPTYYDKNMPSDGVGPLREWFICSSICRRWRNLALATPSLWSHLEVYSGAGASWAKLCVSRAGNMRLVLHIYIENSHCDDPCDLECMDDLGACRMDPEHCNANVNSKCSAHEYREDVTRYLMHEKLFGRIQEVYLYNRYAPERFGDRENCDQVEWLLSWPSLAIHVFEADGTFTDKYLNVFGSNHSGTLRRWRVLNVSPGSHPGISSPPEDLTALTTIELRDTKPGYSRSIFSKQSLMRILQRTANVEILTLHVNIEWITRPEDHEEDFGPLSLPSLLALTLKGPPVFVTTMSLVIPAPRTSLRITTLTVFKHRPSRQEVDQQVTGFALVRDYVSTHWDRLGSGEPLRGTVEEDYLPTSRDKLTRVVFTGRFGEKTLVYEQEAMDGLRSSRELLQNIVQPARVDTLVIRINRRDVVPITEYWDAWPDLQKLVVVHMNDWDKSDLARLWDVIAHRRFRSIRIFNTMDLSKDLLEVVQTKAKELEQQSWVSKVKLIRGGYYRKILKQ